MKNPFTLYRKLMPGDRLIVKTLALLVGGDLFLTWLYLVVPPGLQNMVILQGIIWSATTSVGAIYYALKIAREIYNKEAMLKKAISDKLGSNVVQRLGELAIKVDNQLSKLSPEQRGKLMELAEKGVDLVFGYLEDLSSGKIPKRKPRRIVIETARVPKRKAKSR